MTISALMNASPIPLLDWRQLPPLPDPCGFASSFVGTAGEALIVAGGANFPDRQLWEGGKKRWDDRVFVLEPNAEQWRLAGRLPGPLAYGVSVSIEQGVLCIGGSDETRHYESVFLLRLEGGNVVIEPYPSLPKPVAMAAGARVGNIIYVAGGIACGGAADPLREFYALDLNDIAAGWKTLEPWPGPGRSQAVAAAHQNDFYLFTGLGRAPAEEGASKPIYLSDAYKYSPTAGWTRLPDLPHPAVAAASPAPVSRNGDVLVFGGVDGQGGGRPQDFHQVPRRIQIYSSKLNAWRAGGQTPVARVCVNTTVWQGAWVLPSGERSSGVRSPEVWSVRVQDAEAR